MWLVVKMDLQVTDFFVSVEEPAADVVWEFQEKIKKRCPKWKFPTVGSIWFLIMIVVYLHAMAVALLYGEAGLGWRLIASLFLSGLLVTVAAHISWGHFAPVYRQLYFADLERRASDLAREMRAVEPGLVNAAQNYHRKHYQKSHAQQDAEHWDKFHGVKSYFASCDSEVIQDRCSEDFLWAVLECIERCPR